MKKASFRDVLVQAKAVATQGLTASELSRLEAEFGFRFPPDLAAMLSECVPAGEDWPRWRDHDDLATALRRPIEGLLLDVAHNGFWVDAWGARPAQQAAALELAEAELARVPRLLPVFGHRYLPDAPHLAGNPVFSVHQSDVICYGRDLTDYLENEFGERSHAPCVPDAASLRDIPFWSSLLS